MLLPYLFSLVPSLKDIAVGYSTRYRKSALVLGTLAIMVMVGIIPFVTSAALPTDMLAKTGIGATLGGEKVDLATLIGNGVKFVLGFLAVVFVILIIYGGFKWMTAGGDSKKVDEAKSIIKNAVIGLVIVMCSYAIATVVFNTINQQVLTGGPVK